ncbi:MAG: amidase, partial [Chlamydiota bacterium]
MYKLSAIELSKAFKQGELTAVQIAEYFLSRARAHNEQTGAFLHFLDDRMMKKAALLDEKRRLNQPLGKLAGVPIAVKDNIHIKGELTTCASKFMRNYRALFDSSVTRFLEEEDALLIGKTNRDEFAMGGSTEFSAFQKTKNPWDLNRTPGGSSGGSSACVSSRCVPLSLGSDTGGSIRQPAAFTG